MSDVEKFAHLRGYLEGRAKFSIACLSLTGANNQCAVELLKIRFEKKSAVQRVRINKLIQLPAVFKERDTHERLQKLYDNCEAHSRALKALGVNDESYSAIVVLTILEKLPEQFRLTVTRGTNFLEWSMLEMLSAFEQELELIRSETKNATRARNIVSKKLQLNCWRTKRGKIVPSV